MGNQYERRIYRTKQQVHKALIELLHDKSMQKITIRELCALAGINRSTFYKYYGSQYDVLTEMGEEFLDDISRQLSGTSSDNRLMVERQVTQCFQCAMEQRQLVLMLLENPGGEKFEEKLFSLPKIEELLNEALSDLQDKDEKQAIISFAIHGACTLMSEWLRDGCRQTPEKEAELILKLARRACNRD